VPDFEVPGSLAGAVGPDEERRQDGGNTALLVQLGFPTEVFKALMIFNSYFEDARIDAVVVPMGVQGISQHDA